MREDREWSYQDAERFLKERMSSEVRERLHELDQFRKDLQKAREYISKCKQRYMKDRLNKKTLAAVAEEDPFKELEDYPTLGSIEDSYGFDVITEEQFDHLRDLWELRERCRYESRGKPGYEDRITRMLDWAMNHLEDAFSKELEPLLDTEEQVRRDVNEIMRKHNERVRW